jgi:hypothetical protein
LIGTALENRAIIDVIDETDGIYGREYTIKNGGITLNVFSSVSGAQAVKSALTRIRLGKVSTRP